jgi:hypothetical protein
VLVLIAIVVQVANNKPLKEFAVPLICELAKSSAVTRKALLENNGLNFLLELLRDTNGTFHIDALEALAVWYVWNSRVVNCVVLEPLAQRNC